MLTRFYQPISRQARQISTKQKVKLKVTMDQKTYNMIDNEEMKPRKHPGKITTRTVELPAWLPAALEKALDDMPVTTILADGLKMANYLNGRHPPAEEPVIQAKYAEIRVQLEEKRKTQSLAKESIESLNEKEHNKGLRILKRVLYSWSPIQYNRYAGLLYLTSRGAQEYAVLYRIFHEISTRDKNFRPKTFFDFGSGVGTALWATSQVWPGSFQEHMCIDVSAEMNDLSELVIGHASPKVPGIFYRQYLPLSHRTYDIVVSAYSLLELPNMQTRLNTVAKLWAKTQQYLVIVEQGTNAGFRIINEARDFLLHMQRARDMTGAPPAHVFSPCPHDFRCPRIKADNTPCNFEVTYNTLGLKHKGEKGTERFSYVVFKKGESYEESKNWPRLVRPILVRSKHAICRMCSADGKLNEIIFTASKHGKWMYRCAKSSKWGDRLPIETVEEPINEGIDGEEEVEFKEEKGEIEGTEEIEENKEKGEIEGTEEIEEKEEKGEIEGTEKIEGKSENERMEVKDEPAK